ncbi:cytochrome P460 family protein [Rivibacter subsaxonicus]|uniref:Cytochrome P460 n=1 Tax=Rivibacter subsaxonicus TaxID=457575 RepID=A0A4Q7VNR4_9BURK|nr:cytochrome P460 family protein [Rivibacter subsaxonicus]RZT97854.1 cytochrome P460 [Rivibacter subsaxonicus]
MRTQLHSVLSLAAVAAALAGLVAGCSSPMEAAKPVAVLKDGELAVPADYKSWPKFLTAIQRPDAKQVREIYMHPLAKGATAAGGFPQGTVFVMENWAAQANPDGSLVTGPDGKLVKGALQKVFVMGKNKGWAEDFTPVEMRNGNWVYAAYMADGSKAPDNLLTCRACHAPLTSKDFVHRYDEHFAQKGSAGGY